MEHFYYSFVLTLLHSLWQAAALLCVYFLMSRFVFRITPLQKRNTAYLFLLTQLLISLSCFLMIYFRLNIGLLLESLPKKIFSSATPQITADLIELSFFAYLVFFFSKFIKLSFAFADSMSLARKDKIKPQPDLRVFAAQKAYQLGIKKPVSVWYSAHIKSALTYGFLKPVILLPLSLASRMRMEDIESIILHELNHIKQQDFALNIGLQFVEIIFCFNPFILKLIAELKLEREKSCDMAVLQFNYPMLDYAEALLKSAEESKNDNRFLMNISFGKEQLLKRIQYFSSEKNRDIRPHKTATFFILSISLLFLILSAKLVAPPAVHTQFSEAPTPITLSYFPTAPVSSIQEVESKPKIIEGLAATTIQQNNNIPRPQPEQVSEELNIVESQSTVEEIAAQNTQVQAEFVAIPVAYSEVDTIFSSDITIREESSTGEIITSIYRISKYKDSIQVLPIIMILETPENDSLKVIKSSVDERLPQKIKN